MSDTMTGMIDDVMKPSSDKELEAVRNFLKSHQLDCDFTIEIREPYTTEQTFRVEFVDDDGKSHVLSEHPIVKKKSKWHRVEDVLPDTVDPVLGFTKDGKMMLVRMWSENYWVLDYTFDSITTITHWRELPKPPKKEKK